MQDSYFDNLKMKKPFLLFSIYSQIQVDIILDLSREIRSLLSESVIEGAPNHCDGGKLFLAYGRFWLWILAAYEVTRTLSEPRHSQHLSTKASEALTSLKQELAKLRMPFSKQELRGCTMPVDYELSIGKYVPGDLVFSIQKQEISCLHLLGEFDRVISEIKPEDIRES